MTTNTATKTAPAPRKAKAAPAPTIKQGTAPAKAPTTKAPAAKPAPTVALYKLGPWPAGQRGLRAYARAVAEQLTKDKPKGFTLAEYRQALIDTAATSDVAEPAGGWKGHNMPTWAAHDKQGWLSQV